MFNSCKPLNECIGEVVVSRKTGRLGQVLSGYGIKWLDTGQVCVDWDVIDGKEPKVNRFNFRFASEEETTNFLESRDKTI